MYSNISSTLPETTSGTSCCWFVGGEAYTHTEPFFSTQHNVCTYGSPLKAGCITKTAVPGSCVHSLDLDTSEFTSAFFLRCLHDGSFSQRCFFSPQQFKLRHNDRLSKAGRVSRHCLDDRSVVSTRRRPLGFQDTVHMHSVVRQPCGGLNFGRSCSTTHHRLLGGLMR